MQGTHTIDRLCFARMSIEWLCSPIYSSIHTDTANNQHRFKTSLLVARKQQVFLPADIGGLGGASLFLASLPITGIKLYLLA